MKKNLIISAALLTVASTASAEVVHNTYFEEDFIEMGHKQNYLEGNGWITYGIDAEPSKTKDLYAYYKDGPNGQYHNFFLLEYNNQCYPLSCTNFDPPQPADQWMVTPEFEITDDNAILSFTAACYSIQDWGTASNPIEVRISTTGTEKEDFENVVYSGAISATASTLGSVRVVNAATRVNGYKGQKVRLAFINRGQNGGNVGFTNISVGNYAFIVQDNTPRTAVNGQDVEVAVNIGIKAPVTCPGIDVTLEYEDQKFEKSFTKAFGTTSNSIVYQLCSFTEFPIKITDHSVSYKLTVVPQFEGATPSYITGTITVPELYYPNNVVVEEATATGCGFCPRGTASLQYYSHTYTGENGTGRAIPVAIHGIMNYTDPMNAGVESYIQSLYTLNEATYLPQAMFNRVSRGKDPVAATAFMAEYEKGALYKAEIKKITVPADAKKGDTVTVDFELRSGFAATNVPVRVAVILTEDNVTGNDPSYAQENFYYNMTEAQAVAQLQQLNAGEYAVEIATYLRPYLQGGDLGTSTVAFSKMVYDHVARTIAPSFQGESFGGEWTVDQPVAGQISFKIPDNVTGYINGGEAVNIDNLNVVLLIMDPNDNYAIISSDIAALNGGPISGGDVEEKPASYKDYFHASYDGQEIEQGATVVLSNYHNAPYHDYTTDKDIPAVTFESAIAMVNNTRKAQYVIGGMYYVSPTADEFSTIYPFTYPQFCDVSNCFPPNMNDKENCGFSGGSEVATDGSFVWNLHLYYAPAEFTDTTFEIRLQAGEKVFDPNGMYYDEVEEHYYNIKPIDGTDYSFFVKFSKDNTAAGVIDVNPIRCTLKRDAELSEISNVIWDFKGQFFKNPHSEIHLIGNNLPEMNVATNVYSSSDKTTVFFAMAGSEGESVKLVPGSVYTLIVPEGLLYYADDPSIKNPEITYNIRGVEEPAIASPEFVKLSVAVNDITTSTQLALKGESAIVSLVPTPDWKVSVITQNGQDVLTNFVDGIYISTPIEEDTLIEAVIEYAGNVFFDFVNGVGNISDCPFNVWNDADHIVIENVKVGADIKVYSVSGLLIADTGSTEETVRIAVLPGVYVIVIDGVGLKVKH